MPPDTRPRFVDLPPTPEPEITLISENTDEHTIPSEIYNATFAPESMDNTQGIDTTNSDNDDEAPITATGNTKITEIPPPELDAPPSPATSVTNEEFVEAIETPPSLSSASTPENHLLHPASIQTEPTVMYEKIRLSRILITNDDGIEAEGLQVLTEVAAELADEVWVIAPTHDQSGTALSIGLHHASRVYPRGKNRFAVSGSPADCVALSSFLMKDARPQLLLSGINVGENIGDDTNVSGTLGAALTGLMLRIPSIGISQCYNGDRKTIQWDAARKHLPNLLQSLLQQGWRKETCLSINIPALPADDIEEAVWTRQAARTINGFTVAMRTDLRGGDYYWLNLTHPQSYQVADDSDVAALRRGQISISCIGLDRSREADNENISLHPDRR